MLKTKTITTNKSTLLVVEMPEGITEVTNTGKRLSIPDRKGGHRFFEGNWQLIGRLPDITEEQAGKVAEGQSDSYGRIYMFWDYKNINHPFDTLTFDTAKESLSSLLQANDWDGDIENTYLFTKK